MLHRTITLPLNGSSQEKEGENDIRTERPDEDWPDWEDSEEKLSKYQPVEISIQPADSESELPTAPPYEEEESWDEFEESELISTPSNTTTSQPSKSLCDSAIGPVSGPSSTPARQSKALRLSTAPAKNGSEQRNGFSDISWEQNMKDTRPSKPDRATEAKPKSGYRSAGAGGLGEEFTIEVKKRPDRDPELDLFADMVPDIKLSSPRLFLPIGSSGSIPEGPPAVSHTGADNLPLNTLELTSKFAAVDLTEVRVVSVTALGTNVQI